MKFKEWLSIQLARNPGKIVLGVILLFNVVFIFLAALVIYIISNNIPSVQAYGFFEAVYHTISMVLDPGSMSEVVEHIGSDGVVITIVCLIVVLVGMVTFTGAVIGYLTNTMSSFIENANSGNQKLHISDHIIILNWNSRASEIVHDMMFSDRKEKVVVLVSEGKEDVEREINERIADTIERENKAVRNQFAHLPYFKRMRQIAKNKFKNAVTVVVRNGDVFSLKQLQDLSIDNAKAVVILASDIANSQCRVEALDRIENAGKGNVQTIKTLMQVADITAEQCEKCKIIVEINDNWTQELVNKIIECKQIDGKNNIVAVRVNSTLGQILSQFSLMPELNVAYRDLFSNKGAAFYSVRQDCDNEIEYMSQYIKTHKYSIPLAFIDAKDGKHCYYSANCEKDIERKSDTLDCSLKVSLNPDFKMEQKNIIMLGHNTKCADIMRGFQSFCSEWERDGESIVKIVVIDEKKNLEKMDYYKEYPFVVETVCADVYDKDLICSTIERYADSVDGDVSVLILSDDTATSENVDANALANLVYLQDIINKKMKQDPAFDPQSIDVIVEIIDPKHHDVVNSYSVKNVVISNRYVSKMIAQICEKESLFEFYQDILTYDEDGGYESKEVYVKKVSAFFNEIPPACTVYELMRAIYEQSIQEETYGFINPTLVLGLVKADGSIEIFTGDLTSQTIQLCEKDKLIVFASH